MPITPAALPPGLGAHFSVAVALGSGLTPRRMRAKDLSRPVHGARRTLADLRAEEQAIHDDTSPLALTRATSRRLWSQAQSYMEIAPSGAFICGRSAAAMRGYPVRHRADLDVAVLGPRRAPRGRGVNGRRVEPHLVEVEAIDGIPITTPATTWAMLGRELSVRELVILGDAIVRIPRDDRGELLPEYAGASLEQLQHAIDAGKRVGTKKLNAAIERIRVGSASPLETDYRLDADDAGLPEPLLDAEICDDSGRRLGISEFAYPRYRVAVEVEGDHHRTSKAQWNRDIQKYRDYADAGWEVVRLTHSDIRVRRTATRIVRDVLKRRGWRPAS